MSAALAGAGIGAAIGFGTSLIGNRAQNKAVISQIQGMGENLIISTKGINLSREQLDRQLGDVLTVNALATAKNMATSKVLMSTSGTVGGTSRQVARQAYIDQIEADAQAISMARNQDVSLLNQAISERIAFRNNANALRTNIKSPLEAIVGGLSSAIQGGVAGYSIGQGVSGSTTSSSGFVGESGVVSGTDATSRMNFRNSNFDSYLMRQG